MYEKYRYPGEFEERSDVFVTWMPPYIGSDEFDSRVPCIEIIRNLVDEVQVHVNCGQEGGARGGPCTLGRGRSRSG